MSFDKRRYISEKTELHPRNKHKSRYDFNELIRVNPELIKYVKLNEHGDESIDFANADSVLQLNKALLKKFYDIDYWSIPKGFLCPPIPGRADYIHYAADILASSNNNQIPVGSNIHVLDIGVGANCIFPLLGFKEFGWRFVGVDINKTALESANKIVQENSIFINDIELRLQLNEGNIFKNIIKQDEHFDLCICNPPFHSSYQEANKFATKKVLNLKNNNTKNIVLNFGGQSNELYCKGGEMAFITNMIRESKLFRHQCFWFTTLVSKQSNLKKIYKELNNLETIEMKTIEMKQGNKISRIVAWTYLSIESQQSWVKKYWQKSKI
jgi:23S rRNA (adenine1618-N6)-methyltransferase